MIPDELYGPFGALAALVVVLLAIMHGDLVPGHVYRSEREQRLKAEREATENAKSLATLADTAVRTLADAAVRRRPPR